MLLLRIIPIVFIILHPVYCWHARNDFLFDADDDSVLYDRERREADDGESSGDGDTDTGMSTTPVTTDQTTVFAPSTSNLSTIALTDDFTVEEKSSMSTAEVDTTISTPFTSPEPIAGDIDDADNEEDSEGDLPDLFKEAGSGDESTTVELEFSSTTPYLLGKTPPNPTLLPIRTLPPVGPTSPRERTATFFRVTMNITSERCTPALANRNSIEFNDFQDRWSSAVESVIGDLEGRQVVNVIEITCGSLMVKFDIGSLGFRDGAQINSRLMGAVKQGLLGEFRLSPISYDFMPLDPTSPVGTVAPQPRPTCRNDEFKCSSGECVSLTVMCDGRSDCYDGSDERNCRLCNAGSEIDCGGGFCVSKEYRCDGRQDCPSNKDEENCGDQQCPPGSLSCNDRQRCYSPQQRCDGTPTCLDRSDEWGCGALISVTVSPKTNIVEEGNQVTLTCTADCPRAIQCDVQWGFNSVTNRLPPGLSASGTILRTNSAEEAHSGLYYCSVIGYPQTSDSGELSVRRRTCTGNEYACGNGRCVSRNVLCNGRDDCGDRSDETNCIDIERNECEPPEMRCRNGKCVQKFWRCDGDDDCKDGTDEDRQYCPKPIPPGECGLDQHQCDSRDQCTPRSYLCDGTSDCIDGSDEIGCAAPICTKPPPPTLTVRVGETITISCTCIGKPIPYISWRLNWGHIPTGPRVTETSEYGVGILIIRDARPSDAGAYTCEAVNNQNSVFANPDTIVTVIDDGPGICPTGMFNPPDCTGCYCSGMTSSCGSSNMYLGEIRVYEGVTLANERGVEVSPSLYNYDVTYRKYTVPFYRSVPDGNHFWKLPASNLGKQINSYGGMLKYTIEYETGGNSQLLRGYDVILKGRDSTAYCKAAATYVSGRQVRVSLQLVEKHCEANSASSSADFRIPDGTSHKEYMEILMDVQEVLIRASYSSYQISTSIQEISIETADSRNTGVPAVTVEQCDCPTGYSGNSCEDCDLDYERRAPTSRFPRGECVNCFCNGHSQTCDELDGQCLLCQHNTEGDRCQYCKSGYVGDATRGTSYDCQRIPITECDADGTAREERGRCICKAFATGVLCNRCIVNSYYLNDYSPGGCTQCFCMGVTNNCGSSRGRRDDITVSYGNANAWSLAEQNGRALLGNVLSANGREIIADLAQLGDGSYYWSLPAQFLGNKLAAYGGKLRFNSKFVAPSVDRPNSDPDVILFGAEGIQLSSKFEGIALDRREYNAELSMLESYWTRADSSRSTREHFLMALSDIQTILVKASFTTNTKDSRIGDVSLGVASETAVANAGRAYEVEQCDCPAGYQGSSCETCSAGYMRAPGLYLGVCNRCECNGHSDDCDSERSICRNCAHGTKGRYCERCADGYVRNARDGSPFECINPSTAIVIDQPTIRVTIGGRAELVCRPYSSDLPYTVIVWRRSDGYPLPRSASQSQPGRLIIENVQPSYAGDYVCTITTRGGIDANSIASLIVVTSPSSCPTGYDGLPDCLRCSRDYYKDISGRCVRGRSGLVVTIAPSNSVTVNEGQYLRLMCTARSQVDNSVYVASWTRQGSRLPLSAVEGDGELYIARASISDAGTYVCTGSNQFDSQTAQVVVRVIRSRSTPVMTVRIEPEKLYLGIDRSGSIRCRVTGEVRSVSWKKNGNDLVNPKNKISTSVVTGDTLTIIRMDSSDRGYYYCAATGADAVTQVTSRTPALIDIQHLEEEKPPRNFVVIVNVDVQVRERATARLECSSDESVTAVNIVWSRAGVVFGSRFSQSNGILLIRDTRTIDSSDYTCTVYTASGVTQTKKARLTVIASQLPPLEVKILDSGTGTLEYRVGVDMQLTCQVVAGNSLAKVYWQRGEPNSQFAPNVQTVDGQLYINSLNVDNSGLFICVGTDGRRTDRQEVYIRVIQKEPELEINGLPEVLEAPLNERVEMICSVPRRSGNSIQPTVYWRNSRGQKLTESSSLQATLEFNPVRMSNAGNYTCVAEVPGASASQTLMLKVIESRFGAVVFANNPQELRAQIGDRVFADCKPTTSLPTSTSWRRENSADIPASAVLRGSRLEFKDLRLSDAGVYICTARSSLGSAQLYVTLIVEGPPGIPVITANGERLAPNGVKTYKSGNSVTLTCITQGSPAPAYLWSRMRGQGSFQPLTTGENIQINYGTLSGLGSELVISNVRQSDSGYYNCSAHNNYGSRGVYARLAVKAVDGGLNLVPNNVNVRGSGEGILRNMYKTGETAILRCNGYSSSSVSYRWSFDNGALPGNAVPKSAVLEIKNLNRANQGTYYCTISNAAGSSRPVGSQVFVSGSPSSPTAAQSTYNVVLGGIVRMRCYLPAGADRIEWSRDGDRPLPSSARRSDRNQLLELFDVQLADAGKYFCYAVNSAGPGLSVPISVVIEVKRSEPAVPTLEDGMSDRHRVQLGSAVVLSCVAAERGSTISWSRVGGIGLPLNSRRNGDSIQILNVQPEDEGRYLCQASNQYGRSDPLVHTLVVGPSRPSVGQIPDITISADESVTIGDDANMRCSSSVPTASVSWSRAGADLPEGSAVSGEYLRIYDFKVRDAGEYICTVTTPGGSNTASHRIYAVSVLELSLELKPEGVLAEFGKTNEYVEGTRLAVECKPSEDSAKVRWERLGEALPATAYVTGNTLVFSRLEEIDRGTYRCTASDIIADYRFDVIDTRTIQGAPIGSVKITALPGQSVDEGSSVTLTCEAVGDGVYYEWRRADNADLPDDAKVVDNVLMLSSFKSEDRGIYVCSASNIYGPSKSGIIELYMR